MGHPIKSMGGVGPLDTQTVTTGVTGTAPNRYAGFATTPFGSISDGTSNIYAGAAIAGIWWAETGGAPGDKISFNVNGAQANSGWTKMVIDGTKTLLRSAAVFTSSTSTNWEWQNQGYTLANQPFGAAASVHTVKFY